MIKRKVGLSVEWISEERLLRAAACGIEVLEFSGNPDAMEDWALVPQWVEKTGVKVRSMHLPIE